MVPPIITEQTQPTPSGQDGATVCSANKAKTESDDDDVISLEVHDEDRSTLENAAEEVSGKAIDTEQNTMAAEKTTTSSQTKLGPHYVEISNIKTIPKII